MADLKTYVPLDLRGNPIHSVADPAAAQDAVTRQYLEDHTLAAVGDGVTTVAPVTELVLPQGAVTDDGSGIAELALVTPSYGGQEDYHVVSAAGSTHTIDPADGNIHDLTLSANCTFTLGSGVSGKACALTLILRQDGTGSRHVTWPGSVSWISGIEPSLKTDPSAVDVITLFSLDAGTTWGGAAVGEGGITDIYAPVMATDDGGDHYYVLTDDDGNALMAA